MASRKIRFEKVYDRCHGRLFLAHFTHLIYLCTIYNQPYLHWTSHYRDNVKTFTTNFS